MRCSSERINIAASAQRLDVDNRIALRYYYRIADNILKQADIFREEKNIIDLYIMLLRFSSLVSETIPCHREYRASLPNKKLYLKKKLLNALNELEVLKPAVEQKIDELDRKQTYQVNGRGHFHQNNSIGWINELNGKQTHQVNGRGHFHQNNSIEWPPARKPMLTNHDVTKAAIPAPRAQQFLHAKPVEEQFHRISLTFSRPKEETLSRHSILGPNGLRGQWQPPMSDKGVRYPSNIDLTPVEIPSLQQSIENGLTMKTDSSSLEPEKSSSEPISTPNDDNQICLAEEPASMISFETAEPVHTEIIRQPSPPPVLAEVQDLIPAISSQVPEADCGVENSSPDAFVRSESPLQLHISTALMENFMKMAKSNTDKNLETCGVLAGSLKNRKFYVTALIIPKQESTSDSCHTTNEEEIFEVQDKQSLFPLGWIHTHPSQSCFMSSVDLHTHYSYQIMLPEAVAIVMAPRDSLRTHGIFRLTTPGGMSVIRQCQQRGFHPHNQPPDGGPIYKPCTDVYMSPNLKFDVIDLR